MEEEFYIYATGKKGEHKGIVYNEYGVLAFTEGIKALQHAEEALRLSHTKDLEIVILDITPLVQKGIIPRDKLRIHS